MQPSHGPEPKSDPRSHQGSSTRTWPAAGKGIVYLVGQERIYFFYNSWRQVLATNCSPQLAAEDGGAGLQDRAGGAQRGIRQGGAADLRAQRRISIGMVGKTISIWYRGVEGVLPAPDPSGEDGGVRAIPSLMHGSDLANLKTPGRTRRRRVGDQRAEDLDVAGHLSNWIFVLVEPIPTSPNTRASASCCAARSTGHRGRSII